MISVPNENDKYVDKLLDKMNVEYLPEKVPVIIENGAKKLNCFVNVQEKVIKDGGKIHYGWAIYKSDIICEAERHSVWETPNGDLVDITPKDFDFNEILFVSDNNDFEYKGQLIDNIRINITNNKVVDDFIVLCEGKEKLYSYGERIDDERMSLPEPIKMIIDNYENLKIHLELFLNKGGNTTSKCLCGGPKSYKNCHGLDLSKNIKRTVSEVSKKFNQ